MTPPPLLSERTFRIIPLLKKIFKIVKSSMQYASKLNIKYTKVNAKKSSTYDKSPDWLKCKNATIRPKNVDTY